MKFYRNIYRTGLIIVWLSWLLTGSSCKRLIEIPASSPKQISQEHVFKDSADIISAIAGIYANYKVAEGGSSFLNGSITMYMGCAADELTNSYSNSFMTNTYDATDGTAGGFWTSGYKELYQINAAIQGITGTGAISEALKKSLIAELKVNRAFHYFYLNNLYGGVPIITGVDYKVNRLMARSSEAAVYDFMEEDLKAAIKDLSPAYPSQGRARPNIYTAQALLARIELFRKDYQAAEANATSVIESGLYHLDSLNGIFKDGSPEPIWQLPAIGPYSQTREGSSLIPSSNFSAPQWEVRGELVDSFETGDQRKNAWINVISVMSNNGTADIVTDYPTAYKYKNRNPEDTPVEGYVFLRLAEQYLIRAEARAMTGDIDGALSDVNVIRLRAGLKELKNLSKAATLRAIYHEREIEFCFEWGHRWFDLKRTGNIDAVLQKIKQSWTSTAVLLPVPDAEMQNDPSLEQNDGY